MSNELVVEEIGCWSLFGVTDWEYVFGAFCNEYMLDSETILRESALIFCFRVFLILAMNEARLHY